ncbi:MAG: phosphatidylserine decarboxylase [Pseudomonadales bacterium]|nr:phosphatidylserine decarboxylase [Pseudomonadales bacterium]
MSTSDNSDPDSSGPDASASAALFVRLQNILPHHRLSRIVGRITASEKTWIRRPLIRLAQTVFNIDMDEVQRPEVDDYTSFNDFFTRELQSNVRPMPEDPVWAVSPADGALSQFGQIKDKLLIQAKGNTYSLDALLGNDPAAEQLNNGHFATIYLAPADYHRVHMPFDGKLLRWVEIPGELFSVNALTEAALPNLFCRNERLVCIFETAFGPAAVIFVGALIVASIETVIQGASAPTSPYRTLKHVTPENIPEQNLQFVRGQELGRFLMGSTVITCFPPGGISLDTNLANGMPMRVGQALGKPHNPN